MTIRTKRIINPQRYLYTVPLGKQFYVAVPLTDEDYPKLESYGLQANAPARIPVPHRSATRFNANGRWHTLKHLPKEMRAHQQAYHVIDWHGYHHYGVCWHHRLCYQRELIPPTSLAFIIENGVLYSPLLTNHDRELTNIKAAMNVVLEMLGRCEIWTADRSPALPPVEQIEVPWEILRMGSRDQSDWEAHIDRIIQRKPKGQQVIIRDRHEYLWKMSPDFCVAGTQNFWGYVVYGFTPLNLYVFESNEVNNATYVFCGDWENGSRLTKTEVLDSHIHEARLYHTEKWYERIGYLIMSATKQAA